MAQFFAHYDVLTQRPRSSIFATPQSFYQFETSTSTKNNPALKPERIIDYQIGFKQRVSRTSALTISGFYRELKDMIQLTYIDNAYPVSYFTYGNLDFGTVKGMAFTYDLRKTTNVSLTANYTLQFAEGTGSNQTAQSSLIFASKPNLRRMLPLDFDQRHVIVLAFDYRYGEKKDYNGPRWFGKEIFANAGANITTRAASGFPYSRYREPGDIRDVRASSLSGAPNSARLPWTFKIDMRIDKDFKIRTSPKKAIKQRRPVAMNVYLLVNNVLNIKNVLYVHPFSGSPSDDGFLASPKGQTLVANANGSLTDPESFVDLYSIYVENNPVADYASHYGLPRMARLGIIVNF